MLNAPNQGLCFLHEHQIARCAYGNSNSVVDGHRPPVPHRLRLHTAACALLPVNFSRAQEPPREAYRAAQASVATYAIVGPYSRHSSKE